MNHTDETCLKYIPRGKRGRMYAQFRVTLLLMVGAVLCLTTSASAQTMQSQAQSPATSQPSSAVAPPAGLEQLLPSAPTVTYENGVLTISADNSRLSDILWGIRSKTGADIDIPLQAEDRVVTRLGPGPARDVMYSLLVASRFSYVIVGSDAHPNALAQVLLISKHAAETASRPLVFAAEVVEQPRFRPGESDGVAESVQQQYNSQGPVSPVRAGQQMLQQRRQRTLEEFNRQPD
jgi:hypothetical protein